MYPLITSKMILQPIELLKGLDIKYGINDAFTLDAILVPDFGQTKFDNAILNLEPSNKDLMKTGRFFTEGTNLSTLETYFILEELGAPSNYLMWQQMKK
jgi:hypothetical protein